jgi:large subunit ribosomal protein L47
MEKIKDEMPEINHYLMRRKYNDLRKGKDDLKYIEDAVRNKKKHDQLLNHLRSKYDYKNKRIIHKKNRYKPENKKNVIIKFNSQIEEQIKEGRKKVDKFELLRSHIINYQMLTQKEKRTVLGYIGARRGRDARKEFRKELSLLAQKINHEQKLREGIPHE